MKLSGFWSRPCDLFDQRANWVLRGLSLSVPQFTIINEGLKLIILDALARCYGGNDENSSRDMGGSIKGCDTIKQLTRAAYWLCI